MSDPSQAPLRFSDYEVLPWQRLVRVEGEPVALGARAVDVLMVLSEHRDRVVSKLGLPDRVRSGPVVE